MMRCGSSSLAGSAATVRMPPLDRLKHAVAAVGAAAHDPVGHHGLFAVGGQAQHNAAAGIDYSLPARYLYRFFFIVLYLIAAHQLARAWGSSFHSASIHHALLQHLGGVAGLDGHGFLQKDSARRRTPR